MFDPKATASHLDSTRCRCVDVVSRGRIMRDQRTRRYKMAETDIRNRLSRTAPSGPLGSLWFLRAFSRTGRIDCGGIVYKPSQGRSISFDALQVEGCRSRRSSSREAWRQISCWVSDTSALRHSPIFFKAQRRDPPSTSNRLQGITKAGWRRAGPEPPSSLRTLSRLQARQACQWK